MISSTYWIPKNQSESEIVKNNRKLSFSFIIVGISSLDELPRRGPKPLIYGICGLLAIETDEAKISTIHPKIP